MRFVFLIIVIFLIVGSRARWGRSRILGDRPSGELGIVVMVLLVWLLLNYIPRGFSR